MATCAERGRITLVGLSAGRSPWRAIRVPIFRNDGRGQFDDATAQFGLLESTFPFTGFGTDFLDYDNDGQLDLFISNGAVTSMGSRRGSPYPFAQTNLLVHQEYRHFRDVSRIARTRHHAWAGRYLSVRVQTPPQSAGGGVSR